MPLLHENEASEFHSIYFQQKIEAFLEFEFLHPFAFKADTNVLFKRNLLLRHNKNNYQKTNNGMKKKSSKQVFSNEESFFIPLHTFYFLTHFLLTYMQLILHSLLTWQG